MALSREIKKLRWRKKIASGPLSALFSSEVVSPISSFSRCRWLVADCEMTGLSPQKDAILSIGWVVIEDGFIEYVSGRHVLCHAVEDVGDSVTIHGLSDRKIAGAQSVSQALSLLAKDLAGSIAVFHHAYLDLAFLQKASMACFGCPLSFQYVDTMAIEKRRMERQGTTGSLQLDKCRERYNLPKAHAHNALSDALATAELLVSQVTAMDGLKTSAKQLGVRWA